MSEKSGCNISIGGGVGGLLGVAFVVLRVAGFIDWPWIWVLAPFWIPATLVVLFFIGMAVLAILMAITDR